MTLYGTVKIMQFRMKQPANGGKPILSITHNIPKKPDIYLGWLLHLLQFSFGLVGFQSHRSAIPLSDHVLEVDLLSSEE